MKFYKDSVYDWNYRELAKSKFKRNKFTDIDETQIFCSELVGFCFRALGVLDDTIVPNNLVPRDFSKEFYAHRGFGKWEDKRDLPLIEAFLENEVRLLLDDN